MVYKKKKVVFTCAEPQEKHLDCRKYQCPGNTEEVWTRGWARQAGNQTRLGKVSVGRLSLTRELTCRSCCNQFVL